MTQRDVVFRRTPGALRHNRYSPAIRANGLLFVSGQVGSRETARQSWLGTGPARLRQPECDSRGCRLHLEDVIDVTVFMVDPQAIFERVWNPVVSEYWGQAPHPTVTAVGVTWLRLSIRDQGHQPDGPERPRRSTQQGDSLDLCPQLLAGAIAS